MLSRLANIFRVPDLRNKVIFTLAIIALYQIGANIPVPGRQLGAPAEPRVAGLGLGRPRLPQPLQRRGAGAPGRLRPGRHAVHHQLDHHPAAVDGHPQARGVARPGRRRPEEDHPDHPVPDRGPGRHAVVRPGLRLPRPRLGPARRERRPHPDLQLAPRPLHGADPHGRHRHGHVAGRAHHPARHRPGHVDPDLRQRGGRHPDRLQGHLRGGGQGEIRDNHRRLAGPVRGHRLHGPGAAPYPGHLRPPGGGATNVRRQLDLYPAEGQPVRRDPDHLRQLCPLHPGPACPTSCRGPGSRTSCATA